MVFFSCLLEHFYDRSRFLQKLQANYQLMEFFFRVPTLERHYFAALKRNLGVFALTDQDHRLEYTLELFAEEMRAAGLKILYNEIRWGDIWAECEFGATLLLERL